MRLSFVFFVVPTFASVAEPDVGTAVLHALVNSKVFVERIRSAAPLPMELRAKRFRGANILELIVIAHQYAMESSVTSSEYSDAIATLDIHMREYIGDAVITLESIQKAVSGALSRFSAEEQCDAISITESDSISSYRLPRTPFSALHVVKFSPRSRGFFSFGFRRETSPYSIFATINRDSSRDQLNPLKYRTE